MLSLGESRRSSRSIAPRRAAWIAELDLAYIIAEILCPGTEPDTSQCENRYSARRRGVREKRMQGKAKEPGWPTGPPARGFPSGHGCAAATATT